MLRIFFWILCFVTGYRLWDYSAWFIVVIIALAFGFGLEPDEMQERNINGVNPDGAVRRLMMSFFLVFVMFIYSFFI